MIQITVVLKITKRRLTAQMIAVQYKDTPSEQILYNETFDKKEWLQKLKDLYDSCRRPEVRMILCETDIVTSTSTALSPKNELKLLKDNILMPNHKLIMDCVYMLDDTDYFIISLVNNELISQANRAVKKLGLDKSNVQIMTSNRVILGLIQKRSIQNRDTKDYAIIINCTDHWKIYTVAYEGIPFRILESKTEDDTSSILTNADIHRAILISCENTYFNLSSIIKIHRGHLSDNQDTILYLSEPADKQQELEVASEDLSLLLNSIDYQQISKWLLPKRLVLTYTIICVIVVALLATVTYFFLTEEGSEIISDFVQNKIGIHLYTNNENDQRILDTVNYVIEQLGLKVDRVTVNNKVVTVRIANTSQASLINDFVEVLEANHYKVERIREEKSGNVVLKVMEEDLDIDINGMLSESLTAIE